MLTPGDSVGGHSDQVGAPVRDFDHSSLQGEIVARYRKTAIAAVALSALALTSTAASASCSDAGLERGVREGRA